MREFLDASQTAFLDAFKDHDYLSNFLFNVMTLMR
jgi:hypothetical protein